LAKHGRHGQTKQPGGWSSRSVTMPAYLARFACIGPACEDTCCIGWQVPVDPRSYARYKKHPDPELRAAFDERLIAVQSADPTMHGAALIRLDDDNRCPFLDMNSLCEMQVRGGEALLCETCTTYPRNTISFGSKLERAAVLSCPEAARLALLAPDAMELVEVTEPLGVRMNLRELPLSKAGVDAPLRRFAELRAGAVRLLRASSASIESRLLALGLALRSLDNRTLARDEAAQTFDRYSRGLPAVEEQLAGARPLDSLRTELLRELIVERFATAPVSQRYTAIVAKVEQGLQLQANRMTDDAVISHYNSALNDIYNPYMSQRPWLVANLLVNQVYSSVFPFGGGSTMFDDYLLLVLRYALIKLHLVGVAAFDGALDDAQVIEVVHVFQRTVDHDPGFLKHVVDLLRKNDLSSMAFMAILIVS